jgi:hypothetical protein
MEDIMKHQKIIKDLKILISHIGDFNEIDEGKLIDIGYDFQFLFDHHHGSTKLSEKDKEIKDILHLKYRLEYFLYLVESREMLNKDFLSNRTNEIHNYLVKIGC